MIKALCDNCGRKLHEPFLRVILTDGQTSREAHFCDEHGQKIHDAIQKFASYKEDDSEEAMALA